VRPVSQCEAGKDVNGGNDVEDWQLGDGRRQFRYERANVGLFHDLVSFMEGSWTRDVWAASTPSPDTHTQLTRP
jgi:hypothetical protein